MMKYPILSKVVLVLILSVFLLNLGCHSIGYTQETDLSDIEIEVISRPRPELSVDEIYNKTVRSLIWVVSDKFQGSGVLIDADLRLAVTNLHVVKDNDEVAIFFPVRDLHGVLIDERDFYL
ncbi:hypothetical protein JT359_17045 [Candidatus Poribacteria bacterium]|nr:hypothetical protein [Candidatus Poribacteria bacterium]